MPDPDKKPRDVPTVQPPPGRWDPKSDPAARQREPMAKPRTGPPSQASPAKAPEPDLEDEDFSAPATEPPPNRRTPSGHDKPPSEQPL